MSLHVGNINIFLLSLYVFKRMKANGIWANGKWQYPGCLKRQHRWMVWGRLPGILLRLLPGCLFGWLVYCRFPGHITALTVGTCDAISYFSLFFLAFLVVGFLCFCYCYASVPVEKAMLYCLRSHMTHVQFTCRFICLFVSTDFYILFWLNFTSVFLISLGRKFLYS